jgi:hypothetical protein
MSTPISPELREQIARHTGHRCSYCRSQEAITGAAFIIDHIIPQALGGGDEIDNLCLACWDCNRIKHVQVTGIDPLSGERTALFNPNRQVWGDHFEWHEDGRLIVGLTPTGRATVDQLRLNRPLLARARENWIRAGWHPL